MKRINHIFALAAGTAMLFAAGCDQTYIEQTTVEAPVVESFSPESAPVGEEIVITGQNLSGVKKAYIGGVEIAIKEKVSDTRLSIIAGAGGRNGKITLENVAGQGESSQTFVYTYAVPEVKTNLLQSSVDMGDNLLIPGRNLSAVEAVLFTSAGYDPHQGNIVEQSASELIVRVPYVETGSVSITLRYYDGTTSVTTSSQGAPTVTVNRYKPVFDAVTLVRTAVGRTVKLTGNYMNKVDRILVNGFPAMMSKQPSELTFTVPGGDFPDGDTQTTVVAEYFDGNETYTISDNFVVYVPFVKFWENMTTYAQARTVESLSSFFSPETGLVYSNADWRTVVDPISYQYQANTCTAANTPNKSVVTEAQYLSVNPYFFFGGNNAGPLQLNSPANSNSQLKNFFIASVIPQGVPTDSYRLPGSNGNCYGTPALTFRYLDPLNATENAVIEKVKNQTLENIDEATFPVNVAGKTVGGIGITSAKGALTSDLWAPGKFTPGVTALDVNVDAVVMVLYYNYNGSAVNIAENILRIGFLHIRTINYKVVVSGSNVPPSESDITFNCYWQKYDYDYSKIP